MSLIKKSEGLSKFTLTCNFWRKLSWAGSSLSEIGLQAAAVSYCYEHGTDGKLPKDADSIAQAFGLKAPQVRKAMKELLARGVWVAHGDALEIVDFLEEHPSVADVKAHRQKRELASIKANHTRWHTDKIDPECPLCDADSPPDKPTESEQDSGSDSSADSQRSVEESRGRGVEDGSHFGEGSTPGNPNRAREAGDLVARMVSVCEIPDTQAAFKVVTHLSSYLADTVIDECIGYCAGLSRDRRPRHPNYFEATLRSWAEERNISIPAMNGATP